MLNGDVSGMVNALELYFISRGPFENLSRTCRNDVMLSAPMERGFFCFYRSLYTFFFCSMNVILVSIAITKKAADTSGSIYAIKE